MATSLSGGLRYVVRSRNSANVKALYDLAKVVGGWAWLHYGSKLFASQAQQVNTVNAVAWGSVVALMAAFIGLWALDWWLTTRRIPRRRVRLLEYHAMHV